MTDFGTGTFGAGGFGAGTTALGGPTTTITGTPLSSTASPSFTVTPNPATTTQQVTVDATASTGTITKYEVSYDNGVTWIVMAGGVRTTTLGAGTYQVKVRLNGATVSGATSLAVSVVEAAGQQQLILDPDDNPFAFTLSQDYSGAFQAFVESHSFPAPSHDLLKASSWETEGSVVTGAPHANERTIALQLTLMAPQRSILRNAMRQLESKIAKIARQGGELAWTLPTGGTVTFDLNGVDSYDPNVEDSFYNAPGYIKPTVSFTAQPYGRGDEYQVGTWTQTAGTPAVTFTTPSVPGDVPALGRLEIGGGSASRYRVWWGREKPGQIGPTFQAGQYVTPLTGRVSLVTDSSAYQSTKVRLQSTLQDTQATTYPLMQVTLPQPGTYMVLVRARKVYSSQAANPSYKMTAWLQVTGTDTAQAVTLDGGDAWSMYSLGLVSNADKYAGRWFVTLQGAAMGELGVSTVAIDIDYMLLIPVSNNGWGQATGSPAAAAGGKMTVFEDTARVGPDSSGNLTALKEYVGDYARFEPGQNRVVVKAATSSTGGLLSGTAATSSFALDDAPSDTVTVTAFATPRYLTIPDAP